MQQVVIVIHLMLVLALIGVVLLQKSEGGGLGIGGGSGFMTSRGTANVLTRATAILAGLFFVTSLALSILAGMNRKPTSILGGTSQRADRAGAGPVPRRRSAAAAAACSTSCKAARQRAGCARRAFGPERAAVEVTSSQRGRGTGPFSVRGMPRGPRRALLHAR